MSVRTSSIAPDLMSSPLYLQVFGAKKREKLGVIMAKVQFSLKWRIGWAVITAD